jgi:hypothetical protein
MPKAPKKHAGGRPSIPFDQDVADAICDMLAETDLGLASILIEVRKQLPQTPGVTTIYKWMSQNEEFAASSVRARELQADTIMDQAIAEAKNARVGQIVTEKPDGTEVKTADNVARSQLIVQTYFKRAGQLAPKKYGEKISHEVTGKVTLETLLTAND